MIKLKKKASTGPSYDWRPDFRLTDTLPEISAVRTKLFAPILAGGVALVCVSFILFQEYKAKSINENIAAMQAEISSHDVEHNAKVEINAEFLGLTRTIDEVIAFKEGNLIGSDFLLTVSSKLLEGMYLDRVEFSDGRATIGGIVEVPAAQASDLVNSYLKSLEEVDALQGLLAEYKLTSLDREGSEEIIKFRIEVSNPEEKGKKK